MPRRKTGRPPGRPMKYIDLVDQLDDNSLYTAATVADFAVEIGYVDGDYMEQTLLERQRIRVTLGRLSNNHNFPDEGDGIVTVTGQAPRPGWFGWRWKDAAHRKKG